MIRKIMTNVCLIKNPKDIIIATQMMVGVPNGQYHQTTSNVAGPKM